MGKATSNFAQMIKNSKPTDGGVYALEGVYPVVQIAGMKFIETRKRKDLYICDIDVLESKVQGREAGTSFAFTANFTDHDAAPGNVKKLLAACVGCDHEELTDENIEEAIDEEEQALTGRLVRLETKLVTTKGGGDFMLHLWTPIPEEIQVNAKKLRKLAGFAGI